MTFDQSYSNFSQLISAFLSQPRIACQRTRNAKSLTFFSSNLNNLLNDIADTASDVRFDGEPERSDGVHENNEVGGPHMSLTTGFDSGGGSAEAVTSSSSSERFVLAKLYNSVSSASSEFTSYSSGEIKNERFVKTKMCEGANQENEFRIVTIFRRIRAVAK